MRAGADAILILSSTEYGRGFLTPTLQLQLARFYANSYGIAIVFVATNGPSAAIDHKGRLQDFLSEGEQGILHTDLSANQQSTANRTYNDWLTTLAPTILGLTLLIPVRSKRWPTVYPSNRKKDQP